MWNFLQSCSMWIFRKVPHGRWPPSPIPQNCPYLWKSCTCISYYLAIIHPRIYASISVIKNCNIIFRIWGGGVWRPFGIFPKVHLIWKPDPSLSTVLFWSITTSTVSELNMVCFCSVLLVLGSTNCRILQSCNPFFVKPAQTLEKKPKKPKKNNETKETK